MWTTGPESEPIGVFIATQLNWTELNSTDPVEQRTAKLVVFLFMTSWHTNWVNWVNDRRQLFTMWTCRQLDVELSWVASIAINTPLYARNCIPCLLDFFVFFLNFMPSHIANSPTRIWRALHQERSFRYLLLLQNRQFWDRWHPEPEMQSHFTIAYVANKATGAWFDLSGITLQLAYLCLSAQEKNLL